MEPGSKMGSMATEPIAFTSLFQKCFQFPHHGSWSQVSKVRAPTQEWTITVTWEPHYVRHLPRTTSPTVHKGSVIPISWEGNGDISCSPNKSLSNLPKAMYLVTDWSDIGIAFLHGTRLGHYILCWWRQPFLQWSLKSIEKEKANTRKLSFWLCIIY